MSIKTLKPRLAEVGGIQSLDCYPIKAINRLVLGVFWTMLAQLNLLKMRQACKLAVIRTPICKPLVGC